MARILLVDDSAAVRLTISTILEAAGHQTEFCTSGTGAVRRIIDQGESFDLVITDLHMPQMSGLDLVRNLRAHPPSQQLPVLVMTTERHRSKQVEARRIGASGWITKPVSAKPLLGAVKLLLPLVSRTS